MKIFLILLVALLFLLYFAYDVYTEYIGYKNSLPKVKIKRGSLTIPIDNYYYNSIHKKYVTVYSNNTAIKMKLSLDYAETQLELPSNVSSFIYSNALNNNNNTLNISFDINQNQSYLLPYGSIQSPLDACITKIPDFNGIIGGGPFSSATSNQENGLQNSNNFVHFLYESKAIRNKKVYISHDKIIGGYNNTYRFHNHYKDEIDTDKIAPPLPISFPRNKWHLFFKTISYTLYGKLYSLPIINDYAIMTFRSQFISFPFSELNYERLLTMYNSIFSNSTSINNCHGVNELKLSVIKIECKSYPFSSFNKLRMNFEILTIDNNGMDLTGNARDMFTYDINTAQFVFNIVIDKDISVIEIGNVIFDKYNTGLDFDNNSISFSFTDMGDIDGDLISISTSKVMGYIFLGIIFCIFLRYQCQARGKERKSAKWSKMNIKVFKEDFVYSDYSRELKLLDM